MISIKTIVILLMLGLLFLGEAPPPVVAAPVPAPDTGSDWIRLITLSCLFSHLHDLPQGVAGRVGDLHHPPPHLAGRQVCCKTLPRRQEVIFGSMELFLDVVSDCDDVDDCVGQAALGGGEPPERGD